MAISVCLSSLIRALNPNLSDSDLQAVLSDVSLLSLISLSALFTCFIGQKEPKILCLVIPLSATLSRLE